ncbi:MAG: glycosyltransferase [Anaerovoracaceae bacterium]
MDLVDIHALWIGNRLSIISECCLKSFVMRGHKVFLHVYNKIENIPQGVVLQDANLIIPEKKIIKHKKTGSYALFSDIFRYTLLNRVDGVYTDCDVYCLKPIIRSKFDYLLGYEDDHYINGAVLALPKDSSVLHDLIKMCNKPNFIPPWYSNKAKIIQKFKSFFNINSSVDNLPWGSIGPHAITYYMKKNKCLHYVSPIDIFYPVHYNCVNLFFDSELELLDVVSKRTLCIHLYNEMLRNRNLSNLDKNCLMYKFLHNEI